MQRHNRYRFAETTRLTALAEGSLLDMSEAALAAGIQLPVAMSRGLWTSLVRTFPSARPGDICSLANILSQLRSIVEHERHAKQEFRYFVPKHRPRWIGTAFLVRVQFNYVGERLAAVIVSSVDELFTSKPSPSPAVIPGALMVRLFRVLLQLPLCGRGADTVLIERMRETANLLMRASPLKEEMYDYFARWRPHRPNGFSPEEFRVILSRTLGELLICIGACESTANALLVSELVKYHLALASPLSDLAEMTESLVKLAARLRYQEGPIVYDPFRPLLEACLEMRYSLDRGSTTIPAQALRALRIQFPRLDELIVRADREEYLRLRQWFEKIDDGSPLGNYVNLGRWNGPEPVWQ